jgi:alkaline phosphatase D
VSCSNWEFGYFNAYSNIAARELDAVIHLGDYIYEYGTGKYGDTTIGRIHMPSHEAVTLEDYRTRYSQYHLDAGLRAARQQHPFITIWDDHEVANNVYTSGAQNHQEDEGSFSERSAAAKKAYYEWIPIREGKTHYRSFPFGNLAELIMLDERLEGRTKPVDSLSAVDYLDETRTMLGGQQLSWLENELTKSDHTWKLIGNQVIFSDLFNKPPYDSKSRNLDAWDGYPAEKKRLAGFIRESKLKNIVFLTGDTHASWAIEVTDNLNSKNKEIETLAVELGTTSVSSGNGNESESDDAVILKEEALKKANPHVKYLNERDHGYLLISVFQDYIKSEWWYVKTLRKVDTTENLGKVFTIKSGENAFR